MPIICSQFLTRAAAHFGCPVDAKMDHCIDSNSFGRAWTADVGRNGNVQSDGKPRLSSLRVMVGGAKSSFWTSIQSTSMPRVNLPNSFALIFQDTQKIADPGQSIRCTSERNRLHLVKFTHGHPRRVAEAVPAFQQSLHVELWHGLV